MEYVPSWAWQFGKPYENQNHSFLLIPLHPEEMKHVSKRTVYIFLWSMCHLGVWQFGKPYVNQNHSFFLIPLHPEEMKHVSKRTFYGVCAILGDGNLESHMYNEARLHRIWNWESHYLQSI